MLQRYTRLYGYERQILHFLLLCRIRVVYQQKILSNSAELTALAKRAQTGDKAAYKEFLVQINTHIKKIVYFRWWGDYQYREDIAQNILLALHTSFHTYDAERPILPWVNTIAIYRIAYFSRKHAKIRQENLYSFLEEEESSENYVPVDPIDEYQQQEMQDLVEKALQMLPSKQADIVRKLKIEEMSLQQISDETGMSVGSIKITAHRAYKKLSDFFNKQEKNM